MEDRDDTTNYNVFRKQEERIPNEYTLNEKNLWCHVLRKKPLCFKINSFSFSLFLNTVFSFFPSSLFFSSLFFSPFSRFFLLSFFSTFSLFFPLFLRPQSPLPPTQPLSHSKFTNVHAHPTVVAAFLSRISPQQSASFACFN
jgi:hypothetical protein